MRTIAAASAFAVLALAVPAKAAPALFDETEHVTRTIPMEPGGTLRLKNFSGRVTITGSDRAEIVVDAVRRAPRSRLDRVRLDIHTTGSREVLIDANQRDRSWWEFGSGSNVVETDFDIKVPRRTQLDVSVFSSPVTVDSVEGSHRLHGFSSRLVLNDVSGPIFAKTFSGSVSIHEKSWAPNQGAIDVETFSGSIDLRVPETARGTVTFDSFSGHLNSELPLTMHSSSRRSIKAELGGGGGDTLRFKTFSGSVKIDR
jgi:hypothetical protein